MANVVPADRSEASKAADFGKGLAYRSTVSDDSGPVDFTARADIDEGELDSDLATASDVVANRAVVVSLDGADETTPPGEIYAVTGMSATSVVVSVLFISTKASVATIEVLDPADFTPGANTLTSLDETDRTSDQLIVTYLDV